jgi:hypothetical protein
MRYCLLYTYYAFIVQLPYRFSTVNVQSVYRQPLSDPTLIRRKGLEECNFYLDYNNGGIPETIHKIWRS